MKMTLKKTALCSALTAVMGMTYLPAAQAEASKAQPEPPVTEQIRQFTYEQREDATQAAKKALEALDQDLAALQRKTNQAWDSMSKEAQQESQEAIAALKERRREVGDWYSDLEESTAESWEDSKEEFSDAYDDLKDEWEDVAQELDNV